jgi:hypothetical protein
MDIVAIAYGSASKTNLERVDVVGRAILRNILGAKRSTPVEMLYVETGTESLSWRTKLLTRKYLINLIYKPNTPMHKPFVQLATTTTQWKPRSIPGLIKELDFVKFLGTPFLTPTPTPIHLQISTTQQTTRLQNLRVPPQQRTSHGMQATDNKPLQLPQQQCTGDIHQGLHRWIQIIIPRYHDMRYLCPHPKQ